MPYDFQPYYELPEGVDPQDPVAWTYAEDPSLMCRNWLSGLLGLRGKDHLLPAGVLDDPFLLGFAHGFSLAYLKSWNGSMDLEHYEYFALEMFKEIFGPSGRGHYKLARKLAKSRDSAYAEGIADAGRFLTVFHDAKEYVDDPIVGDAVRRAQAHVERRTHAKRHSREYLAWLQEAEDHALYDSFFLDPLRRRMPALASELPSALETMSVPDLSAFLDERNDRSMRSRYGA